jgi:tetratricopeptide (TPR) repeat protein
VRVKTLVSIPLVLLAVLLVITAPAPAQSGLNQTPCFDPDASDDDTIISCTSLLAGGTLGGENLAATYDNRGFAYSDKRQDSLALADFNQAIRLNPNDAQAFMNRAHLHFRQDHYDLAIADDNTILRLNPNHIDAINNRGVCSTIRGKRIWR